MIGDRDFWDEVEFGLFVIFAKWAGVALLLFVGGMILQERQIAPYLFGLAIVMFLPFMIHFMLLTIWHWKARYKGTHSKLWGAVLILETTGWFRILYFFMHVLPDRKGSGRYARAETLTVK